MLMQVTDKQIAELANSIFVRLSHYVPSFDRKHEARRILANVRRLGVDPACLGDCEIVKAAAVEDGEKTLFDLDGKARDMIE